MKNQECCTHVKECARGMLRAAARPTLRQTLHYDVGIYPDASANEKSALQLHLGGTHSCPLWKIVLVAAVALITLVVSWKCRSCDQ